MIIGFSDKYVQSCEAVTSMRNNLSEDIYSEAERKYEECLLNEGRSNKFMFEAVVAQEEILVKEEEDRIQSEELIYETTIDTIEHCDFQTENLRMNAGTVSDDEVLKECQKEIALLEYFLENSEYDREIAKDRVHYSEQENIMEADGMNERLVDNLENYLENYLGKMNQHTDVLIEEEIAEQHTEVLAEERKELRPYGFCFNSCFMNAGFIAGVGENLTQLSSQIQEEEENSVELFNPWNKEVELLEIMLNNQNSV